MPSWISCGAASAACQARIASPQALTRDVGAAKLEQVGLVVEGRDALWRGRRRPGLGGCRRWRPAPAPGCAGSPDRPDRDAPACRSRQTARSSAAGRSSRAIDSESEPRFRSAVPRLSSSRRRQACAPHRVTASAPTTMMHADDGRRSGPTCGPPPPYGGGEWVAEASQPLKVGVSLGREGRIGHRRGQQTRAHHRQHAAKRRQQHDLGQAGRQHRQRHAEAGQPAAIVQRSAVAVPASRPRASPARARPARPARRCQYSSRPCR